MRGWPPECFVCSRQTLFTTQTPAVGNVTDGDTYELGTKIQVAQSRQILALRYCYGLRDVVVVVWGRSIFPDALAGDVSVGHVLVGGMGSDSIYLLDLRLSAYPKVLPRSHGPLTPLLCQRPAASHHSAR